MADSLADLRQEYTKASLDIDSAEQNPYLQFEKWFTEAKRSEVLEPNAFVLGTVDNELQPFQRTVLMKALNPEGIVFYTNYESRKANHIQANDRVSALFPWYSLERQVNIIGKAVKISTRESLKYFTSRPHGSQLGAWVSNQSSIISSRSVLEIKLDEMKRKFQEGKVPLPDFWGGYRIEPISFEFWQGRKSRLHDRLLYSKTDSGQWKIERLAP